MHASLRRGLFMERLCPPDSQSYDAYFLTGAFSLLDRITKTSFARLLSMISVAKEIAESISTADGQWSGHIHLVNAIEQNDVPSIVSHSKELGLRLADVNRALLSALAAAEDIESEDFLRNTELDNARPV
jgi:c-di-GMP-related signal transduction protein